MKLYIDFNNEQTSLKFRAIPEVSCETNDSFVVVLSTHDTCNLACRYCFLKKNRTRKMDSETLRRVITEFMSFFAKKKEPMLEFLFHGPEITQDIRLIEDAICVQKEVYNALALDRPLHGKDCINGERPFISNTIQTNGTLINESLINTLHEGGFKYIGISLDGAERNTRRKPSISQWGRFF